MGEESAVPFLLRDDPDTDQVTIRLRDEPSDAEVARALEQTIRYPRHRELLGNIR